MKYTSAPWDMQASDVTDILRKEDVFLRETETTKANHKVLVSANGVTQNEYSQEIQRIVTLDDLFREC